MSISTNKILGYILVLFSLLFFGLYFINQGEILRSIASISSTQAFFLLILVFVSLFLNGLKILMIQKIFQVNMTIMESTSLASVNAMWNYLPLTGGLLVRGAYLKRKYKFPWLKFIGTVVASVFASMIAFGAFGLLVTLIFIDEQKIIFSSVFITLISIPFVLFFINNQLKKQDLKIFKKLQLSTLGLDLLIKNKPVLFSLFLLDFVLIFIDSFRIYLVSIFSGNSISFTTALLVTPLTILASLVNITPGALVIREALIALTTSQLNYSLETGVVVATIDRAALVIGIFIGGIVGSIYLSKRLNEK